jgi:hypothetical protein
MLIKSIIFSVFCFSIISFAATADVTLVDVKGDVKVRYGIEEQWHPAKSGMVLKNTDTILSGNDGQVKLNLSNGKTFNMAGNTYLDIVDLKNITEQELFLFLMSKKIQRIEKPDSDNRLKISNVSVVHGVSQVQSESTEDTGKVSNWSKHETNGAVSLYVQNFFPNTIVKLTKIINKYSDSENKGKLYYYLAKSFDALDMKGQARENFQTVMEIYKDKDELTTEEKTRYEEAGDALDRLKQ